MFVFGRFSMIEDVNEAACNLLGYARSELVERHGSELMPPEARRMAGLSVDQMRRGESEGCRGRLVRHLGGGRKMAFTSAIKSAREVVQRLVDE